jgi:hypothetical protein
VERAGWGRERRRGGEHVDDEGHHRDHGLAAGGLQAPVARLAREQREMQCGSGRFVLQSCCEPGGALLVFFEIFEQPAAPKNLVG